MKITRDGRGGLSLPCITFLREKKTKALLATRNCQLAFNLKPMVNTKGNSHIATLQNRHYCNSNRSCTIASKEITELRMVQKLGNKSIYCIPTFFAGRQTRERGI